MQQIHMRSLLATCLLLLALVSISHQACPSYKYWDTTTSTCLTCKYSCLNCTSSSDCTLCDTTNDHRVLFNQKACLCQTGYYDDKVSTVCKTCTSRISNCVDCFYNSTYSAADASLGALQYGCFACANGFILINNACNAYAVCSSGSGANPTTNVCELCSTGCLICTLSNKCTTCNVTANYFLNSTTSSCVLCQLFGCLSCQTLSQCQTCQAGLILVNGECHCANGTYFDPSTSSCKNCSIFCPTCTGPSSYECTSCNPSHNRLLIGTDCQCDSYNYRQSATGPQCQKINNNLCQRGYIKIQATNQCVQICGDGWRIGYQCDDGGVVNTDGCSDGCRIQVGFVCLNQGSAASICRLKTQVQFDSIKIKKDQTSSTLYFDIDISPDSVVYNNFNLAEILHFRGGFLSIKQATYDKGRLYLTTNYSKNMEGRDVQLQVKQDYYFDPNYPEGYETLYNTTKATFTLSSQLIYMNISNNLKPNEYSEQTYTQAQKTTKATLAIMIIMLIVCLGALIIKNSLSLLININAMQICYISLVTIQGMHPVTASILSLRPLLGYSNLNMFTLSQMESSIRVQSIGYVEDFANNFNVMFFIQGGFIAASILADLASHKKPMIKLAASFLQRQALLIIIFNLPTVFFTVTLMIKPILLNIAFAAAACVVIVYQLIHLVVKGKTYFGFKEVFDFSEKGHFKKFIVVYFLARLGTCLSFSFINVEPLKSLIAGAAFQGAFIIFIAFVRPFYHSFNNILMMIAEILAISFFGSIYASEAVNTLGINQRQRSVDVMIYLLGGIMVISVINLIYSLVVDVKEGGKKLKAFNELVEAKNKSDEL